MELSQDQLLTSGKRRPEKSGGMPKYYTSCLSESRLMRVLDIPTTRPDQYNPGDRTRSAKIRDNWLEWSSFQFPSTEDHVDIREAETYEGLRELFDTDILQPKGLEPVPPTNRNISGFRVFTGRYDIADHQPFPRTSAPQDWSLSRQYIRMPALLNTSDEHTLLAERRENSDGIYSTQGWGTIQE